MLFDGYEQHDQSQKELFKYLIGNINGSLTFKIKHAGYGGQTIKLSISDHGLVVANQYIKSQSVDSNNIRQIRHNVDVRGFLFQFIYSNKPMVIDYQNIVDVSITSKLQSSHFNLKYRLNRGKVVTATFVFEGVDDKLLDKFDLKFATFSEQMRLQLLEKFRVVLLTKLHQT